MAAKHPLDPLTSQELADVASTIKASFPAARFVYVGSFSFAGRRFITVVLLVPGDLTITVLPHQHWPNRVRMRLSNGLRRNARLNRCLAWQPPPLLSMEKLLNTSSMCVVRKLRAVFITLVFKQEVRAVSTSARCLQRTKFSRCTSYWR